MEQRPAGAAEAASDDAGFTPASHLSIEADGAAHYPTAACSVLPALEMALAGRSCGRAGIRLYSVPALTAVLEPSGPITAIARSYLGPRARPVRAILFDKSLTANWSLGWHQDRTIAVRERRDIPGYGPWSIKSGVPHVEPPFAAIEAMLTLRVHLDDVPPDNSPLLIAHGSHRIGRIPADAADAVAGQSIRSACLALRGDVWAYATPILHASAASTANHRRRRVLHIDYSAETLPPPLEWLGF